MNKKILVTCPPMIKQIKKYDNLFKKFNLDYFLSHNMSLTKFQIPNSKNTINQFYFNSLINPHSIEKIICYTTR